MSTDDIYILPSSSTSSVLTSSNMNASPSPSTASSISYSTNINTSLSPSSSSISFISTSPRTNSSSLSPSSSSISLTTTSSKTNSSSLSSSINSTSYTSERISHLLKIEKENFTVISNTAPSAVAPHWSIFGFPAKLNKDKGGFERILGFTSCRKCKKTFVYGQHSGTNNMKQHSCVTNHLKASSSMDSSLQQMKIDKLATIRKTLTSEQSNTIKDLTVRWVCQDIRPISIIEDDGLRALIQECVRLGSIYGNLDVNDVLRGRTTISNHIQNVARLSRERIKEFLREPYNNGCLTISPDFWTDKYKQISYLGVTAVVVDHNYKYYTLDLFCKPFQEYEKTGENVLIALQHEMKLFGIDDLSKVNIVCDRGSNFLKAFQHLNPITCCGHRLNNVLKRSFFQHEKKSIVLAATADPDSDSSDEEFDLSDAVLKPIKTAKNANASKRVVKERAMTIKLVDAPPAAQQLIRNIVECKSLAKYIKKAGLNKDIQEAGGHAVRQAIVVRWLSLINLLESIDFSFTQIKTVLIRRKQQQKLAGISHYLVKQTVRLLKPFQSIMKMIQSGSNPTLYLVLPCTLTLRKALNSWDDFLQHIGKYGNEEMNDDYDDQQEDEGAGYLRQRISTLLRHMVNLDIRHYCATLLHPDYRTLRGCSNDERIACHNYIREQLKSIVEESSNNDEQTQKKKRFKSDHGSILDDFKDDPNALDCNDDFNDDSDDDFDAKSVEYSIPMIQSDELSRYLSMKIDMDDYNSNVLSFWKSNADQLPCLSKFARKIHSIPATSAGIERQFSIAGLTLTDRRASLDPDQLDNMLCIRAAANLNKQM